MPPAVRRLVVNRAEQSRMHRVWVVAVLRRPLEPEAAVSPLSSFVASCSKLLGARWLHSPAGASARRRGLVAAVGAGALLVALASFAALRLRLLTAPRDR